MRQRGCCSSTKSDILDLTIKGRFGVSLSVLWGYGYGVSSQRGGDENDRNKDRALRDVRGV